MPLTLTLISEAFPVEKRGAAIGLWGGITGLAVAAGPVVGGAIVGGINWHWIFWLNVPVGLVLIPLAASRLTESFGPRPRLDIVGLALAGMSTAVQGEAVAHPALELHPVVLSLIDGQSTVGDILERVGSPDAEALGVLCDLCARGVITLERPGCHLG